MNYARGMVGVATVAIVTISICMGNGERLTESSYVSTPRNFSLALTPDQERLCVVHNIISSADPRGGLMLVDLSTGQVIGPHFFSEEGRVGHVVASTDPDGTTRCFVTVSKQSGQIGSEGRNRVEVVNITNDQVVIEDPIILENFQSSAFGPWGIVADPVKKRLYVADRGHYRVHVIDNDPASGEDRFGILSSVSSFGVTTSVATTPDGNRAYAANRAQNNVVCIDTTSNTVGGPACNSLGTIPVSVGPSAGSTDITISPDASRAYTVFNLGQPCVSVIDVDPTSTTFNQEIAVIPTTGQRLESLAINSDGSKLFVVSGATNELLIIDTAAGRQTQRIPVGRGPYDVVEQPAETAVAYVSNPSSQTISIINTGKGAFIGPDGDTRKTDGMWDFEENEESCADPSTPGKPDPGLDAPAVVGRPQTNHFVFSSIDDLEKLIEVFCFDPHPVTGSWTSCEFILPPVEEAEGVLGAATRLLFQLLDISEARRHRVTIDGYGAGFRPESAVVESQIKHDDGSTTIVGSSFEMRDDDGDGVADGLTIDAADLVSTDLLNFTVFDAEEDGIDDFIGSNLTLGGLLSFAVSQDFGDFLPLADTNGDGAPDSPAYDFDGDGSPDPEIPLFPFMAGPSNPKDRDLWLYFAQFGDGGSGGPANLFSQVLLLNLDAENPAQVTVLLKDDDGNPLTVDLNGEEVIGETNFTIPAGGLRVLETDGQGPLIVGSASVRSDRAVAGVIVFGGSAGLAGVGSSHVMPGGFLANIETNSGLEISTGFAVLNLETAEVTLNLTLEDTNGNILARGQLPLKGMGHRALFVYQIEWTPEAGVELDFSDFRGLLRASANAKLAATVLQTRPGEYATLPVARSFESQRSPGSFLLPSPQDEVRPEQKLYFPQFADGGVEGLSTRSQILLFNLTEDTANARIILKDDAGEPLTVDLDGEVVVGEKEIQIPAGGLKILESDGQGELTVGSVIVIADQALAGVIVFAGETGAAGVGACSPLLKSFLAPMESNDAEQVNTGIAVMNLEGEEVELMVTLCDQNNQTLATAKLPLSGMGHRALFLNQFDWTPESGVTLDFSDFRGVLKVTSAKKLAAAVLQTRTGIFATQPVVPTLK